MSNGNGQLVVSRPRNRLANLLVTTHEHAGHEQRLLEDEAADRVEAQQLAAQLATAAAERSRAAQRYGAALGVIAELHHQQQLELDGKPHTAAEQMLSDRFYSEQHRKHRQAMIEALKPYLGDGADVEKAVDADIRKVCGVGAEKDKRHSFDPSRD